MCYAFSAGIFQTNLPSLLSGAAPLQPRNRRRRPARPPPSGREKLARIPRLRSPTLWLERHRTTAASQGAAVLWLRLCKNLPRILLVKIKTTPATRLPFTTVQERRRHSAHTIPSVRIVGRQNTREGPPHTTETKFLAKNYFNKVPKV